MMLPIDPQLSAHSPIVIGFLGGNSVDLQPWLEGLGSHLSFLVIDHDLVESAALLSCDAVVGVLDGDLGIGAEQILAWSLAADNNIPRIIWAVNTVSGRADFDEAIALSELVLNEDIAMRYYPIVEEDEKKYIGLLDVLTNEILLKGKSAQPADPEHISLTLDDHEELVELLVHLDPSDELLLSHTQGSPISLPRLKALWQSHELVTVLPMDDGICDGLVRAWLNNIQPRWAPAVTSGETTSDVNDCVELLGIGITQGVARIWNHSSEVEVELHTSEKERIFLGFVSTPNLIMDGRIRIGDTVRPINTRFLVSAPSS